MAYGIIYKFRAETAKYKSDVKINILKNGYADASYDKYLGAGGVTLTKDSGGVICGTSLSFTAQADTDFEYLNFFESAPREYLVQLLIDNAIIWQGYLIGDEYREAFRNPPYDVAITAADGLGLLKNYPYTVLSTPTSKTTRIDGIREILKNTGLSLNISLAYAVATAGGTNIFAVDFADDYYHGWTCYEVLEKMIPPDATITQHGGLWLIRRNEQDSETTPKIYSYVDGAGYTITDGIGETVQYLEAMGAGDVYPIGQAELNMKHAWNSLEMFSEHGKRSSFLYNHNFSEGLEQWTEGPTTGYVETWDSEGGSYVKLKGEHTATSEDVPEVYVKQSFPYTAVSGQDFALELKFCANGYLILLGVGKKRTNVTIKGRVEYTDGEATYYLDETDGWTTTNRNFERAQLGNIGEITWSDLKIYTGTPPLASGTMTVYLYAFVSDPNTTLIDVNFTDIIVRPVIWENYPDSYRYDITLKENATERQTVTILPTSAPDVANFDRLFYNGHTVSGSRVDAFLSAGNTYTFTNLILNSLKFLHGTTRQLLQGYFRGENLNLNSIISAVSTSGRKYFVESGSWEVLNDKFNLELIEIPGTADGSTWAIGTTDFATSAEWSNNTTQGSGSSETVSGGAGGTMAGGGSWLDPYFELVNSGTTGEYIRALRDFASTGEITAYNTASPTGSFWDNMPVASTTVLGGIKIDGTTISIDVNGVISSTATGGGEGVSDHGALTGLSDNDHPQYSLTGHSHANYLTSESDPVFAAASGNFAAASHNHSGVYQPSDSDLTAIAALTGTGIAKRTGVNTWALDSSTYLTAITKAMVEAVLTGAITSHTHAYEAAISKATGYLRWTGTAWEFKNEAYSLSSHNHSGTYEPAFTKNTAFNKNFGSASGTVAEGNDSRFHAHTNAANLAEINQDLATTDDVHFLSADVTSLEVDSIIDGVLQTGYGYNLLRYSNTFDNAAWTKYNCTASDNEVNNPFGGGVIGGCLLEYSGAGPTCIQQVSSSATGNYTFSVWIKGESAHTMYLRLISDTQTPGSIAISVTTSWQRFYITTNFTSAHTYKYCRIELSNQSISIFGAQLESGTAPTRYINTFGTALSDTGAHVYGGLRVVGAIVASDEVTAFSDSRLKHDITLHPDALSKVREIKVVDYCLNGDRNERRRTGVIAQQLIDIYPQFVEGSENDYYSVNYPKLVSVAIKAIQELSDKVEQLEQKLKEHGINN